MEKKDAEKTEGETDKEGKEESEQEKEPQLPTEQLRQNNATVLSPRTGV